MTGVQTCALPILFRPFPPLTHKHLESGAQDPRRYLPTSPLCFSRSCCLSARVRAGAGNKGPVRYLAQPLLSFSGSPHVCVCMVCVCMCTLVGQSCGERMGSSSELCARALIKYIIISTTPGGGVGDLINGRQVMKLKIGRAHV